jgi:hypothetical protein
LKILLYPVHVYASLRGLIVVWIGSSSFICDSLDFRLILGIRIIGFNKRSILYKNVSIYNLEMYNLTLLKSTVAITALML